MIMIFLERWDGVTVCEEEIFDRAESRLVMNWFESSPQNILKF